MEKHFLQLTTWIKSERLNPSEKQTLLKEIIRRARTADVITQPKSWYKNIFSKKFLPLSLATLSAVILVIYNTTSTSPITSPHTTDIHDPQYQVLSAYEQADKIAKEKASLKKIIQDLPPETIQTNVAKELKNLEALMVTDSSEAITLKPDTETNLKAENTVKTTTSESVINPTPAIVGEKSVDTKTVTQTKENIDKKSDLPLSTSETNLSQIKIKDYYEKIQAYEKSGNYTEALILIGEVKKLIKEKTPDEPEKETNKKQ